MAFWEVAPNASGALGTALLVMPAAKASRLLFQLAAVRRKIRNRKTAAPPGPAPSAYVTGELIDLERDLVSDIHEWSPLDTILLFSGLFLTFCSYAIPLVSTL
jgi:hypothetical protein